MTRPEGHPPDVAARIKAERRRRRIRRIVRPLATSLGRAVGTVAAAAWIAWDRSRLREVPPGIHLALLGLGIAVVGALRTPPGGGVPGATVVGVAVVGAALVVHLLDPDA